MSKATTRWSTWGLRAMAVLLSTVAVSHCRPAVAQTSVGPRQSSPVALTRNDRTLVCVNPENHSITVFDVRQNVPDKVRDIGVGSEPNSLAIHPNGNTVYVANSLDGTVSV